MTDADASTDAGATPEATGPMVGDDAGIIRAAPRPPDPRLTADPLGDLSPAEQSAMREAAGQTDFSRAMKSAMQKIILDRQSTKADGEDGQQPAEEGAEPPSFAETAFPTGELDDTPEGRQRYDTAIREATGEVITAEALDFISQASKPFERRLEFIRMEQGDEAVAAELEKGDNQVMAMIYRGSDEAMADGMKTIGQGVELFEKSIGAAPDSIRDMINDSGMLADLKTHQMVLSFAKSLLGGALGQNAN